MPLAARSSTSTATPAHNQPASREKVPRGILIRPRQQFRYAFILVAGGVIAQSAVVAGMAYFINVTSTGILSTHGIDPDIGLAISNSINWACMLMMLVAVAFALVAVLVGVKLSHRIYGTMVPFSRHIEQLKAGNYSVRLRLRRTDDLKELRDSLNSLAETLDSKYPSTPSKAQS